MKELITATTISDARKAGLPHIYVSPGALITPQAKDDAKAYGIAIVTQEASAPVHVAAPVSVPVMAPVTAPVSVPSTPSGFVGHAGQGGHGVQGMQGGVPSTAQYPVQGMPQSMTAAYGATQQPAHSSVYQSTYPSAYQPAAYQPTYQSVYQPVYQPASHRDAQVGMQTGGAHAPYMTGNSAMPMATATPSRGSLPAYASTQQQRVIMNNPSTLDPSMQQLVEQVLKAVAPATAQAPVCAQAPQGINPAFVATQVTQQLNSLLASRGGIAAFPGMEATIASIVAEYTNQGQSPMAAPHVMAAPMPAPAGQYSTLPQASQAGQGNQGSIAGIDVVPFVAEPPKGRVQGEVSIEEALLPGQGGPGVTRFTFADTSLVWTFTQAEVLVVTHGTIEVQGAGGVNTLTQGSAIRVASGTAVTLVAKGPASCVSAAWPAK